MLTMHTCGRAQQPVPTVVSSVHSYSYDQKLISNVAAVELSIPLYYVLFSYTLAGQFKFLASPKSWWSMVLLRNVISYARFNKLNAHMQFFTARIIAW